MNGKYKILVLIIACAFAFTGCKSSKSVADSSPEYKNNMQRYETLVSKYNSWETVTVNGKVSISVGKEFSSSMQMKMINGKSISISIRPMLGIEMVKLYLSTDSIFMIDKMNKRYVAQPISRFTQGIPFNIVTVQDLFLNRAFSLANGTLTTNDSKEVSISTESNGNWKISPKGSSKYGYSFLLNNNNDLISLVIDAIAGEAPYSVDYSDFKTTERGNLPAKISMKANYNERPYSFELLLDPLKMKWNQQFSDKLEINDSYRLTSVEAYMSLLKNL